jgi:hypothetical protein
MRKEKMLSCIIKVARFLVLPGAMTGPDFWDFY